MKNPMRSCLLAPALFVTSGLPDAARFLESRLYGHHFCSTSLQDQPHINVNCMIVYERLICPL